MKPYNLCKQRNVLGLCGVILSAVALLGQQTPPMPVSVPLAGATISDFKGKVELKAQTQGLISPSRGLSLPAGTLVSTEDGKLLLHLTDGSEVLLGPHTRLMLTQPVSGDWKYLQLIIGRIRAEVRKRLGGTPSFQIGTPSAVISVRGTRFLVEVNRRGVTEVDVEQGLVELKSVSGLGTPVLLGPGFSSRIGEDSPPEPARPTREFRPELERPERETSTDHKLELDDIESRSAEHELRNELRDFDDRDESRPGTGQILQSPETESPEREPSGPDL